MYIIKLYQSILERINAPSNSKYIKDYIKLAKLFDIPNEDLVETSRKVLKRIAKIHIEVRSDLIKIKPLTADYDIYCKKFKVIINFLESINQNELKKIISEDVEKFLVRCQ